MQLFAFILILIGILLKEHVSAGSVLCQETHIAKLLGFKQRINTNEYYWLSNYRGNAIDARNLCIRMGAELVHIRNETENTFIKSLITNETEVWTGGVYVGNGNYKWITGFNITYTNWLKANNEPNGQSNGENYISIYGGVINKGAYAGYWNDNPEGAILKTLCVIRCR